MSELRRCAAFWRNMEYSLDQMLEEVNSRSGDKWFSDDDKRYSGKLTRHLGDALSTVRMRYVQVLHAQIDDWEEQAKQEEYKL